MSEGVRNAKSSRCILRMIVARTKTTIPTIASPDPQPKSIARPITTRRLVRPDPEAIFPETARAIEQGPGIQDSKACPRRSLEVWKSPEEEPPAWKVHGYHKRGERRPAAVALVARRPSGALPKLPIARSIPRLQAGGFLVVERLSDSGRHSLHLV